MGVQYTQLTRGIYFFEKSFSPLLKIKLGILLFGGYLGIECWVKSRKNKQKNLPFGVFLNPPPPRFSQKGIILKNILRLQCTMFQFYKYKCFQEHISDEKYLYLCSPNLSSSSLHHIHPGTSGGQRVPRRVYPRRYLPLYCQVCGGREEAQN